MTKLIVGMLLTLSVVPMQQPSTDTADLATGIRQVEEENYRVAAVTLDGVVRRLSGDPAHAKDLALAHLYAGAAYLGLQQNGRAETEMRDAARLDPALTADSKNLSPAAVALFEKTRHHAEKGSKTLPLLIGGGAALAGGVALAAGGGNDAASPVTMPVVVTPSTAPAARPTPPPTTVPSGPQASAFDVHLLGAGTITQREVQVGTGTLVARYEGAGSEVQVIVNDPSGTNVAVDTNYTDTCNGEKLVVEARTPVIAGTYSVVVKVGKDIKAACCRLPKCGCQAQNSPGCFFANGQISIFYPAP